MSWIAGVVAAAVLGAVVAVGGSVVAVSAASSSKPAAVDKPLIQYGVR